MKHLIKEMCRKQKSLDTIDRMMLGIFVVVQLFMIWILRTNMEWFYLDQPWHILTLREMNGFGGWLFQKFERFCPMIQMLFHGVSTYISIEPSVHFVVQYGYTLCGWLFAMGLLSKMKVKLSLQIVAVFTFMAASPFGEQMFTLGKYELLLCTGVLIHLNALYSLVYEEKPKLRHFLLFEIGMLISILSKETGLIVCVPAFLVLCISYFGREKQRRRSALKAFAILGINIIVYFLYRHFYGVDGEYTSFGFEIGEYIHRIIYYFQYCPDMFVLGIVSFIGSYLAYKRDVGNPKGAMLIVCNLTGWAYVFAISIWKWNLSYYLYPAIIFFGISLVSVFEMPLSSPKRKVLTMLVLLAMLYGMDNSYKAAVSHIDIGKIYTQSIRSLIENTSKGDRVLIETSAFYEELPTQTRILLDYYDREIDLLGTRQEIDSHMTLEEETVHLFGYTMQQYNEMAEQFKPRIGDYILVYLNERSFRVPIRTVNPSGLYNGGKSAYETDRGYELELIDKNMISRKWSWLIDDSKTDTALAGFQLYRIVDAMPYTLENSISFGRRGIAQKYLGRGWHGQEDTIRWAAEEAELIFKADWNEPKMIEITCFSYNRSGDTVVYCNDAQIGTIANNPSQHMETLIIPPESLNADGMQKLTFVTEHAKSPEETGEGHDVRRLGVAVSSIHIVEDTQNQ